MSDKLSDLEIQALWENAYDGGPVRSLLVEVRQARAILTPEVLRLIEAGRAVSSANAAMSDLSGDAPKTRRQAVSARLCDAQITLLDVAVALPFEKPAGGTT